ncbi:hypothetical protein TEA_011127 [Camellia sinensis var. sinensis]|uniref:Uncharacterized protein n=1 Tax=Camellia sinensis var. sinensis TaxID=542762 RepID=A0A4S4D8X1_CAMSN|nr:hypothetical protein TEA_011127 [Camellia sinensis var. sinensis]
MAKERDSQQQDTGEELEAGDDDGPPPGWPSISTLPAKTEPEEEEEDDDDDGPPPGWTQIAVKKEEEDDDDGPPPGWQSIPPSQPPTITPAPTTPPPPPAVASDHITSTSTVGEMEMRMLVCMEMLIERTLEVQGSMKHARCLCHDLMLSSRRDFSLGLVWVENETSHLLTLVIKPQHPNDHLQLARAIELFKGHQFMTPTRGAFGDGCIQVGNSLEQGREDQEYVGSSLEIPARSWLETKTPCILVSLKEPSRPLQSSPSMTSHTMPLSSQSSSVTMNQAIPLSPRSSLSNRSYIMPLSSQSSSSATSPSIPLSPQSSPLTASNAMPLSPQSSSSATSPAIPVSLQSSPCLGSGNAAHTQLQQQPPKQEGSAKAARTQLQQELPKQEAVGYSVCVMAIENAVVGYRHGITVFCVHECVVVVEEVVVGCDCSGRWQSLVWNSCMCEGEREREIREEIRKGDWSNL